MNALEARVREILEQADRTGSGEALTRLGFALAALTGRPAPKGARWRATDRETLRLKADEERIAQGRLL